MCTIQPRDSVSRPSYASPAALASTLPPVTYHHHYHHYRVLVLDANCGPFPRTGGGMAQTSVGKALMGMVLLPLRDEQGTNNKGKKTSSGKESTEMVTASSVSLCGSCHDEQQQGGGGGGGARALLVEDTTSAATSTWTITEGDQLVDILLAGVTRSLDKFATTTLHEVQTDLSKACSGSRVPKISIQDYITRIITYINRHSMEQEVLLHRESSGFQAIAGGLVLLNRCAALDVMDFTPSTIHRALLVCCLLANKLVDDNPASNLFWSRVGGISLKDMNALELLMCTSLQYHLFMLDEFEAMVENLSGDCKGGGV